jgi:hypothetical protein
VVVGKVVVVVGGIVLVVVAGKELVVVLGAVAVTSVVDPWPVPVVQAPTTIRATTDRRRMVAAYV